ncbi:MAG: hypothetical protein F4X21_09410 [Acidimicrobiia bacterium]|nr:hypothetical protein [Acidimicrobiia bacterium]
MTTKTAPPRRGALLSEILPPEERAIEAVVARYMRVSGAVTRVARTLSGRDDLRVVLGASSRASEQEVVIDPGLFSAAYSRHAPVSAEETALASALHEVIHLVSADFDQTRPLPIDWVPEDQPYPTEAGEEIGLFDALQVAGGPPAEVLFFAIEDARQERHGLKDYPGARSVLQDIYRNSTRGAIKAAGPLTRFTIACFLTVGHYADDRELERRLDSRSGAAWADSRSILAAVSEAADPWKVGGMALKLVKIARAHGLLQAAQTDETARNRTRRQEAEKEAMTEGLDRVRLFSPIVADADHYHETRQAAEGPSYQDLRSAETDQVTNEGINQLLRVSQAPLIYLPTGLSGTLSVARVPETFRSFAPMGKEALLETAGEWHLDRRRVAGELYPLFIANQRRGLRSGFDAGDLSPHAALLLGGGLYQRMFERRSVPTRRSYSVSVLVDGSASMLQPRRLAAPGDRRPWGLAAAMLGAWTLAAMCSELRVDFEVSLFNRAFVAKVDDTEWTYSRRRTAAISDLRQSHGSAADRLVSTVNHYVLSEFHEPWRRSDDLLAGLFWTALKGSEAGLEARRNPRKTPPVSLFEKGANVDELNVTYAARRQADHGARVRVLVVLADGMTRGSVEALNKSVQEVEGQGTTVLGIGVGDDTVASAYRHNQVISRPDELANSMVTGVRMALRRGLARDGNDAWWIREGRISTENGMAINHRQRSA